jgi:hypothetical protein
MSKDENKSKDKNFSGSKTSVYIGHDTRDGGTNTQYSRSVNGEDIILILLILVFLGLLLVFLGYIVYRILF